MHYQQQQQRNTAGPPPGTAATIANYPVVTNTAFDIEEHIYKSKMWLKQRNQSMMTKFWVLNLDLSNCIALFCNPCDFYRTNFLHKLFDNRSLCVLWEIQVLFFWTACIAKVNTILLIYC